MFKVKYKHRRDNIIHTATFETLEDAQLWWDTINYLKMHYQSPLDRRPV